MLPTSRVAAPEVLAIERENLPYQKRCTAMPVGQRPLRITSSCETVEDKSSLEAMSTRRDTEVSVGSIAWVASRLQGPLFLGWSTPLSAGHQDWHVGAISSIRRAV